MLTDRIARFFFPRRQRAGNNSRRFRNVEKQKTDMCVYCGIMYIRWRISLARTLAMCIHTRPLRYINIICQTRVESYTSAECVWIQRVCDDTRRCGDRSGSFHPSHLPSQLLRYNVYVVPWRDCYLYSRKQIECFFFFFPQRNPTGHARTILFIENHQNTYENNVTSISTALDRVTPRRRRGLRCTVFAAFRWESRVSSGRVVCRPITFRSRRARHVHASY